MDHEPHDADDPMELVGVQLPPPERADLGEMADAFAEEFLRMGHPAAAVLGLFRNPFYAGPNLAWRELGEVEIGARVERLARIFGAARR